MKKQKPLFPPPSGRTWSKRLAPMKRREIVLKNHKGNLLKSAQAMDYLSKGSFDKETKILARNDSDYFLEKYRKVKR